MRLSFRVIISTLLQHREVFEIVYEIVGEYSFQERIESLQSLILRRFSSLQIVDLPILPTESYGEADCLLALAVYLKQPIIVYFENKGKLEFTFFPCNVDDIINFWSDEVCRFSFNSD